MPAFNWKEFALQIPIHTDIATAYKCWATQDGLEKWFLRSAVFVQPNGSPRKREAFVQAFDNYTWLWHGYDDNVLEQSMVLDANGTDLMRFGFSGGCIVTVRLEMDEDMLLCRLAQQMPMDELELQQHYFIECQKGWTFYLSNLKSVLEGGLDLRNRDLRYGVVVSA